MTIFPQDPYFIADYMHLAFFSGLMLSYIYYRYRHISLGGTLAIGYLASAAHSPVNILMTIVIALLGWAIIRFGILKIALPNSRQLFAMGIMVGVVCGALWVVLARALPGHQIEGQPLEVIGVIIPGLLCHSFRKQGIRKTLVPISIFTPAAAFLGLALTYLSHNLLGLSGAELTTNTSEKQIAFLFGLSTVSVLLGLLIQQATYQNWKLRTGGYITVGMLIALWSQPLVLVLIAVTTGILAAIYIPYQQRVPLFGKDRFVVLCLLSFTVFTLCEYLLAATTGNKMGGAHNILYAILPVLMLNDALRFGVKNTAGGMALSAIGCATLALPFMTYG